MIKISIISFILGVLIILSTSIKIKRNKRESYTISKFKKYTNNIKLKLSKNKFFNFLINEEDSTNKKLLKKLQIINQCKQAEKIESTKYLSKKMEEHNSRKLIKTNNEILRNLYITKITIVLLILIIGLTVKINLNTMVVNETLNSQSIYINTRYRISKNHAQIILNYIGDDYKIYMKNKNKNGLVKDIYQYVKKNKLELEQNDINIIANIYEKAYFEGRLDLEQILSLLLISLLSTLIVNLYINVKFKICNIKLLSEFYSMELLALLHMNREELNVYEILTELNKYSIYLKPYLTRCLNRYSSDPIVALDKLIKEVNDENFSNFILILKSCLDNTRNVNSDVLKLQRKLRFLNDKIENDQSIQYKQLWLTIAQFPIILMFILNLLIPFLNQLNLDIIM